MPKCVIENCKNYTRYKNTKAKHCTMHLARIKRHGYPERKKDAYLSLEKLPHKFIDNFIRNNHHKLIDKEIAKILKRKGFKNATVWNVKYRRRKLGFKKYLYGEIKKHKAWIRTQAMKKYGQKCELCRYKLSLDVHHITPKSRGGAHEVDNLMVVCPNCHALITRKILQLDSRKDIEKMRKKIVKLLNDYSNFG